MMIRTWEIMQELMNLWKDEELVKEFIAEKDLSCCVGYVGVPCCPQFWIRDMPSKSLNPISQNHSGLLNLAV